MIRQFLNDKGWAFPCRVTISKSKSIFFKEIFFKFKKKPKLASSNDLKMFFPRSFNKFEKEFISCV